MSSNLLHFPRWAEILENSYLPEAIKKSYKITLHWYLGWCQKRRVGCSVDSARAFVEWAHQEKNAEDWMVEQWKVAIQWYFVEGILNWNWVRSVIFAGQRIVSGFQW